MGSIVEASRFRRTGTKKSRNGCITCKTRRVKCDEAKPRCQRCLNYGTDCEGYSLKPASLPGYTVGLRKPLMPRPYCSSLPCAPQILVSPDSKERRYFYIFNQEASQTLGGYFKSPFWTQIVLQMAHEDASVMHALAAIGALTEIHTTMPFNADRLYLDVVPQEQGHFALTQYGKAIASLRQALIANPRNLRTALIGCLLFNCIECLQGNAASMVAQIGWGINLLAQAQRDDTNFSKEEIDPDLFLMFNNLMIQCQLLCIGQPLPQIVKDFTSLDGKHVMSSDIRLPEVPSKVDASIAALQFKAPFLIVDPPTPLVFHNVLAAKGALDILLQKTYQQQKTPQESFEEHFVRCNWHLTLLKRWNAAFTSLASTLGPRIDEESVLMLRVYYNLALIIYAGVTAANEMAYDSVLAEFSTIILNAAKILANRVTPSRFEFSFETGLVPPLFIVGSKCRDPVMRRRAIELFYKLGGQEGLWHPVGLAQLAEWIMGTEEEGWDRTGILPLEKRINLSAVFCEEEKMKVHIEFERKTDATHSSGVFVTSSFDAK